MEKLKAEDFPKPTRRHPIIQTSEDDWYGISYKPNSDCPVCKGAGFVHLRDGGRIIYSKIIPCSAPGCLRDSIKGKQPSDIQKQTFESFQPIAGTEKALKAAHSLAHGEAKFIWLLLHGPPGNGKTHLGNAITKVVKERGLEIRMILAADLFSLLRENMESHKVDSSLRYFKEISFLIIDDYGVEYGSEWEQSIFDQIMTSRYALDKPTVLITNKDLTDLPERIQSRFRDNVKSRAVHNSAGDYRLTRDKK